MKFKELVPPLELCKLIPEGEFEDSALVWLNIDYVTIPWKVVERKFSHYKMQRKKQSYPAPTLEEIMEKLTSCVCYKLNKEWSVGLVNDSAENAIKDSSGAASALKLWLELKGIEYGK